jgi:hypothetical protein
LLCRNRIALIQKEEERARKKIQETKERATEIINLRHENDKRIQAYVNAAGEIKQLQQVLIAKNREQDNESKKARHQRLEMLQSRRKEEVNEMLMEKKYLTQLMIQEQTRDILLKQKRREEIKKMEEEMKAKKEQERREKERRIKEMYEQKLQEEAEEAKRAEKLVRALEKKEREWIEKLRSTQYVQDTAFEQLEQALHGDGIGLGTGNSSPGMSGSGGKHSGSGRRRSKSPKRRGGSASRNSRRRGQSASQERGSGNTSGYNTSGKNTSRDFSPEQSHTPHELQVGGELETNMSSVTRELTQSADGQHAQQQQQQQQRKPRNRSAQRSKR